MSISEISVERVPLSNLVAFAEEAESNPNRYAVLPITRVRATAQAENPAAAADDVSLIVAYQGGNCVGYLGILPCWLTYRGDLSKIYALSTFYVATGQRNRGAAAALMQDAIALDYDFLLAGFTPSAERFYRRYNEWFDHAGALPYVRIHLYPTVSLLWHMKRRFPFFSIFISVLQALNALAGSLGLRFLTYRIIRPSPGNRCADLDFRKVEEVHETTGEASRSETGNQPRLYRGASVINWMIRYPWIVEEEGKTSRYKFSHYRDRFRFLAYEIFNHATDRAAGYVVFSISHKNELTVMKILDFELENDAHLECILNLALREAYRWKVDIIDGPADIGSAVHRHPLLKLITQRKQRGYFIHRNTNSAFSDDPQDLVLNFCDGDTAFT